MRLKAHSLSVEQNLWEFDAWVTPSIVDIRSTERFRTEMRRILSVLDALTVGGHQTLDQNRFSASLVDRIFERLDALLKELNDRDAIQRVEEFLVSLSALLFMVTGKSDNNNKCQFPIFLRNNVGWTSLPGARLRKKKWEIVADSIPRVMDSETYMSRVARLYTAAVSCEDASFRSSAELVLFQLVDCVLADVASREQLTAFLMHYRSSRESGRAPELLLTPLVVFQVRGSVAASGGHEPEQLLRARMTDWGLIRGVDFNTNDVVIDATAGTIVEAKDAADGPVNVKTKTRAYDFALPYKTPNWAPRIFIQSQFYAGDSGSVSHKNVDQTQSSRLTATKFIAKVRPGSPPPRFLEYVDGAGYAASLNGDLKSLLSFSDTAGFFQVRSAPIRLRRELQHIGFLTSIEIAHAVIRCKGNALETAAVLSEEGYAESEISRSMAVALEHKFLSQVKRSGRLSISDSLMPLVRQYLILDLVAREGREFPSRSGIVGVVLVPGYGPHYGLRLSELDRHLRRNFSHVWPNSFMGDLQTLCDSGFVVLR